jgi:hypothetical protein
MVSPTISEEGEGLPIPTNASSTSERQPRRRGSRVLQSSLDIAFSCKSREQCRGQRAAGEHVNLMTTVLLALDLLS